MYNDLLSNLGHRTSEKDTLAKRISADGYQWSNLLRGN